MLESTSAALASKDVRDQKGITGLETAIILIAFVVVASVFSFTVLSTGIFTSERSKETVYAGLKEVRSSFEPLGHMIAFKGKVGSTETIYKVTFLIADAAGSDPVDLTPPYTTDDTGTDPDVSAGAEYSMSISYSDRNQFLPDVPWTVTWPGYDSNDNLLEKNEKAEITVWLLNRNTATAIGDDDSVAYMTTEGGITSSGTLLTTNDEFTIELKPPKGAVLKLGREVPGSLEAVMDLQ